MGVAHVPLHLWSKYWSFPMGSRYMLKRPHRVHFKSAQIVQILPKRGRRCCRDQGLLGPCLHPSCKRDPRYGLVKLHTYPAILNPKSILFRYAATVAASVSSSLAAGRA